MSQKSVYPLQPQQLACWQHHGYMMINNFFNESDKENLLAWASELSSWPETPGKWMKYFERCHNAQRQLCRVENFLDYHQGFNHLLNHPSLIAVLSRLMGEPAVLFKEKINYKLPGGAGFRPHQDAPAFFMFKQDYHITMMIAIDDATLGNGCLQVAKGGYNQVGLLAQSADGSLSKEAIDQLQWTPLPCKTGDIILFDSYLPHFSEKNRCHRSRRAIYATYNKKSQGEKRLDYYRDKRDKFPPECERDPDKDYSRYQHVYNLANPIE